MSTGLVLLANGTASNKVVNEYGKTQPPKVTLNNSLSSETYEVTREGGRMDGVE